MLKIGTGMLCHLNVFNTFQSFVGRLDISQCVIHCSKHVVATVKHYVGIFGSYLEEL